MVESASGFIPGMLEASCLRFCQKINSIASNNKLKGMGERTLRGKSRELFSSSLPYHALIMTYYLHLPTKDFSEQFELSRDDADGG